MSDDAREIAEAAERGHDIMCERIDRLNAENKRMRDIISPGDAAAYEEGMAWMEAENKALREQIKELQATLECWQDAARDEGLGE